MTKTRIYKVRKFKEYCKEQKSRALDQMVRDTYLSRNVFFSYFNYYRYVVISGSRGYGKTFMVMEMMLKRFLRGDPISFYWVRLTPTACANLLKNNAEKLIDIELRKRFSLLDTSDGTSKIERRGNAIFIKGKLFLTVLAVSNFYTDKGVAHYDKDKTTYVICDEFQREKNEKNTFDVAYAFFNQLENIVRDNPRSKVVMLGNAISSVSDILLKFKFIPHSHGIFKIKSYSRPPCVIFNLPNSDAYMERRKRSLVSGIMDESSSFNNTIENQYSLLSLKKPVRPTYVLVFPNNVKYTIWDGSVVTKYRKENVRRIAMKPFIADIPYNQNEVDAVVLGFRLRNFLFDTLITQKSVENLIEVYFKK